MKSSELKAIFVIFALMRDGRKYYMISRENFINMTASMIGSDGFLTPVLPIIITCDVTWCIPLQLKSKFHRHSLDRSNFYSANRNARNSRSVGRLVS